MITHALKNILLISLLCALPAYASAAAPYTETHTSHENLKWINEQSPAVIPEWKSALQIPSVIKTGVQLDYFTHCIPLDRIAAGTSTLHELRFFKRVSNRSIPCDPDIPGGGILILLIADPILENVQEVCPSKDTNGAYHFRFMPRNAGTHSVFAFVSEGGFITKQIAQTSLSVPGLSQKPGVQLEAARIASDKFTYCLTFAPGLAAGRPTEASFGVTDPAKNNFRDLQEVNGTHGRMLLLSEDASAVKVLYPKPESAPGISPLLFDAQFPTPGYWKVFIDVRIEGRNVRQSFGVRVPEAEIAEPLY